MYFLRLFPPKMTYFARPTNSQNTTPMFACCRKPEPEVELEIRTQPKPTKTTFREGSDSPKILVQQANLTKQIVNSLENDKPDV